MIRLIKAYKYDNNYDYVKTFSTVQEQNDYFNSLEGISIDDTNYLKDHISSFKVPFNYDYLVNEGVNYILFNNGYKDMFAFIVQKEYISEEVTRLIFEIDVIQTYMFDFTLKSSFVERKTCSLSELTDFDEGLYLGEHVIDSEVLSLDKDYDYYAMFNGIKEQELVFDSKGNITDVVSIPSATLKPSTLIDDIPYPIYFMKLLSTYASASYSDISIPSGITGDGTGVPNTGDITVAKVSVEGFRFIKGYEGFAPYPYQDSGGYWTICYGITAHGEPSIYNELAPRSPITESEGAQIGYNLKNENYASPILSRVKALGCTKQYQYDALISLAYNCGTGVVLGSNSLTNAILANPNDETTIRAIWENFYVTSGGNYLEGLHLRRVEECNMFFNKAFEVRGIATINSSGNIDGSVTENNGDGWLPTV